MKIFFGVFILLLAQNSHALFMKCGATKKGADWISDFSIKVQENSTYKVEFEDHKFVFSILNSLPDSLPWRGSVADN